MKYKRITRSNGKNVYDMRVAGEPHILSNYVDEAGNGEPLDTATLEEARGKLDEIVASHPEGRTPGKYFDASASVALHECLKASPEIVADDGFWRWLALSEFSDIVEWRHPGNNGISKPENYGIGTIWNNLIARLWYRAEIVRLDSDEDPYSLARRGDVDLWRSHILRVNPGSCRNYARALIRYQYPDNESARLTVDQIREFAKQVRRLQATVALELLSEDDAQAFVKEVSAKVQEEFTQA